MLANHRLIYRLHATARRNENETLLWVEINTMTVKFIWVCKGPRVTKTVLKKNKIRGLRSSDFEAVKLQ